MSALSFISFSHPFVLLLLLAVAGGALLAGRRLSSDSPKREWLWTALQALAPALLVLALAEPQLHSGSSRPTVLAVDQSASIDAAARALERRWTAQVEKDECVSPCRVVRFASTPSATPPSLTGTPGLDADATDLQSAIGAAIGLTPSGGRVAVLSDGGQTRGDLLATAPLARRRNVEVDWVRLGEPTRPDAAITAISTPPVVHLGDTVPLTLTVHSTVAARAVLSVRTGSGHTASQQVALRAGDNPLLLLYTAAAKGSQSFQATISLAEDAVSANNSLAAVTDVVSSPTVLSVGGTHSAVPALLAHEGLSVTQVEPGSLPTRASSYSGEDAVVLNDVSASQLGVGQIAALNEAVRDEGLGLVVLGGQHSFSLGGYARSPLQQVLPLSSLVPGNLQRRNLAIELVVDHSGSMSELAGGVEKIAMARTAASQSAAFLRAHQDALGIVDFDIKPHTLVPLQLLTSAADERRVDRTVAGLQADGGTTIYLGLQSGVGTAARQQSRAAPHHPADRRHQPACELRAAARAASPRPHLGRDRGARLGRRPLPARRDLCRHRGQGLRHRQRQGTASDLRQRDAAERQARTRHRSPVRSAGE